MSDAVLALPALWGQGDALALWVQEAVRVPRVRRGLQVRAA